MATANSVCHRRCPALHQACLELQRHHGRAVALTDTAVRPPANPQWSAEAVVDDCPALVPAVQIFVDEQLVGIFVGDDLQVLLEVLANVSPLRTAPMRSRAVGRRQEA